MDVPKVWSMLDSTSSPINGKGVTIGIVDVYTVDPTKQHPAVASKITKSYIQLTGTFSSHGVSCASIAAGNDGTRFKGIAYGASLFTSDIMNFTNKVKLITSIFDKDVDVFSMSVQTQYAGGNVGLYPTTQLQLLAPYIIGASSNRGGRGQVFVVAAGNDNLIHDEAVYEMYANTPNTVTIGAINPDKRRSSYSNPGAAILVSGPGGGDYKTSNAMNNIGCTAATLSSTFQPSYTTGFNGTSAATPHIAGLIALLIQVNNTLTNRDIEQILVYSSTLLDTESRITNAASIPYSLTLGYGVPNAYVAYLLALSWPTLSTVRRFAYTESTKGSPMIPEVKTLGDTYTAPYSVAIRVSNQDTNGQYPTGQCRILNVFLGLKVRFILTNKGSTDLRIQLRSPSGTVTDVVRSFADTCTLDSSCPSYVPRVYETGNTIKIEAFRNEPALINDNNGTYLPWTVSILDIKPGDRFYVDQCDLQVYTYDHIPSRNTAEINLINTVASTISTEVAQDTYNPYSVYASKLSDIAAYNGTLGTSTNVSVGITSTLLPPTLTS